MVRFYIETPLRHGFLFDKIKDDSFVYQQEICFEFTVKLFGRSTPLCYAERGREAKLRGELIFCGDIVKCSGADLKSMLHRGSLKVFTLLLEQASKPR